MFPLSADRSVDAGTLCGRGRGVVVVHGVTARCALRDTVGEPGRSGACRDAGYPGAMRKVLIANRGEIAVRSLERARTRESPRWRSMPNPTATRCTSKADEAYSLGGATAAESYLVIDKIIAAAKESGADAIHPAMGSCPRTPSSPKP